MRWRTALVLAVILAAVGVAGLGYASADTRLALVNLWSLCAASP